MIEIKCRGSGEMHLHEMEVLQGDLKSLSESNYSKLKSEILEQGFIAPFFIWTTKKGENYLLDGTQRYRALEKMKNEGVEIPEKFPVISVEAKSKKEAAQRILAISSQYGEIESEGLYDFICKFDLNAENIMERMNFDGIDFDAFKDEFFGDPEPEGDEDDVPEPPVKPVSQFGDVWMLGNHRLMCGDATSAADVDKLLNGVKPNLMVTDPPYGVNYDPEWREGADLGVGKRSKGKVKNDDRASWAEAYSIFPGNIAYVWHSALHSTTFANDLIACGFSIRSQIIWAKQHFAMSRGDYHWQHEPCWYAVKNKGEWKGDRKQTTIWEISNNNAFQKGENKREDQFGHSTQKPVECMLRPILNHTSDGQAVYDPFLGSGTTIIAAEKSGRICFALEIDPVYCDVIVQRWQDYTGEHATKEGTGESYSDLVSTK